ncbi:MAG: hypothetical protein LBS66_03600 [Rhodospirillaceae bacterium]|nr:hypothetical protein [Rhodospirillaceae bacterium]
MNRQINKSFVAISPLLWSVSRRLAIAILIATVLWLAVGWALDWWK